MNKYMLLPPARNVMPTKRIDSGGRFDNMKILSARNNIWWRIYRPKSGYCHMLMKIYMGTSPFSALNICNRWTLCGAGVLRWWRKAYPGCWMQHLQPKPATEYFFLLMVSLGQMPAYYATWLKMNNQNWRCAFTKKGAKTYRAYEKKSRTEMESPVWNGSSKALQGTRKRGKCSFEMSLWGTANCPLWGSGP